MGIFVDFFPYYEDDFKVFNIEDNINLNNKGMKIVKVPHDIKNILDIDNADNLAKEYFDKDELRIDNTNIFL